VITQQVLLERFVVDALVFVVVVVSDNCEVVCRSEVEGIVVATGSVRFDIHSRSLNVPSFRKRSTDY